MIRRLALGYLLGVAVAISYPEISRGSGAGEDDRGSYVYEILKLRFARSVLELNWWPDWEGSGG